MTVTHSGDALSEACDYAIAEFEAWIDRHFAARRVLVVERHDTFWVACIGDTVLYRSPDGQATYRFAKTFAERTPGVSVAVAPALHGFRVKVPDNVVPIREGVA